MMKNSGLSGRISLTFCWIMVAEADNAKSAIYSICVQKRGAIHIVILFKCTLTYLDGDQV